MLKSLLFLMVGLMIGMSAVSQGAVIRSPKWIVSGVEHEIVKVDRWNNYETFYPEKQTCLRHGFIREVDASSVVSTTGPYVVLDPGGNVAKVFPSAGNAERFYVVTQVECMNPEPTHAPRFPFSDWTRIREGSTIFSGSMFDCGGEGAKTVASYMIERADGLWALYGAARENESNRWLAIWLEPKYATPLYTYFGTTRGNQISLQKVVGYDTKEHNGRVCELVFE